MSKFTPSEVEDLNRRWRRAANQAEADKPAILERDKKLWAALNEPSLSGELRRAIFDSPLHTGEVSERANVPVETLIAFLHGEAPLDSEAVSRIAGLLGCHLVASP